MRPGLIERSKLLSPDISPLYPYLNILTFIPSFLNYCIIYLLVVHSATQYMSLSVCLSVTPFQINSSVLPNSFIEFPMASQGFQMVLEESIQKILQVSRTFHVLQLASTGIQSVKWILSMTLKTKLTSYYAQRSANNWSC